MIVLPPASKETILQFTDRKNRFFPRLRSQEEYMTSQRTSYSILDGWQGFKEGNIKASKYVKYMSVTIKR